MLVVKVISSEKKSRNKTQSFSFHSSKIEILQKRTIEARKKTIPENFSASLNQENIFWLRPPTYI